MKIYYNIMPKNVHDIWHRYQYTINIPNNIGRRIIKYAYIFNIYMIFSTVYCCIAAIWVRHCGVFEQRVAAGKQYIYAPVVREYALFVAPMTRDGTSKGRDGRTCPGGWEGVLRAGNVTSFKPIRCVRRPVYCYTKCRPSSYLFISLFLNSYMFFVIELHKTSS